MLRTVLLSLALLGGGFSAAAWLTHDFQVWTDEGARRLEVALRPVPVPAVTVDGTGIAPSTLPQLLTTQGHVTIADLLLHPLQNRLPDPGQQFCPAASRPGPGQPRRATALDQL